MAACARPIAWETLVDYWAHDLPEAESEVVEAHVMGCGVCARSSERVAAITERVRNAIPPFITRARLASLRARGLRLEENSMSPGERKPVVFGANVDLLIHRLGGLDLSRAQRVRVVLRVESTGDVLVDNPSAPFERDTGEIIIACQRHFAAFPPDVVFDLEAIEPDGTTRRATYAIPHTFEAAV